MERPKFLPKIPTRSEVVKTVTESFGLYAAIIAVDPLLKRAGIPINRGEGKEESLTFRNMPIYTIVAPLWEEAFFRGIPQYLSKRLVSKSWVFIPANAAFALAHNYRNGEFDTKKIPLYQFAIGLYLWNTMEKRGFTNAVLAHSTFNITAAVLNEAKKYSDRKSAPPTKG